MTWEIYLTDEVNDWLDGLGATDEESYRQVVYAIDALADTGPSLGRPLVDRINWSIGSTGRQCTTLKNYDHVRLGRPRCGSCLCSIPGAA